jgi:hypothetical protein
MELNLTTFEPTRLREGLYTKEIYTVLFITLLNSENQVLFCCSTIIFRHEVFCQQPC